MSFHRMSLRKGGVAPHCVEQLLPGNLTGAGAAKMKQHLGFHCGQAACLASRIPNGGLAVIEFRAPDPIAAKPVPALQDGRLNSRGKIAGAKREFNHCPATACRAAPDPEHGKRGTVMFAKPGSVHQRRIGWGTVWDVRCARLAILSLQARRIVQLLDEGVAKYAIGDRNPNPAFCRHATPVTTGSARVNSHRQ